MERWRDALISNNGITKGEFNQTSSNNPLQIITESLNLNLIYRLFIFNIQF